MLNDKQMKKIFRVLLLHVVTFCLVLCFDWQRNILFSSHELLNHRLLVGLLTSCTHNIYSMHVSSIEYFCRSQRRRTALNARVLQSMSV